MNIGRYRVTREIGRGSMGIVYEAHDPNLDITVAIKVLRHDRLSDEGFARRFLAEAKALGRLDHPNVVRVFNVDEHDGTVYIVMEYLEGESLGDLIQRRRFTVPEIVEIGASVAEALDDAHGKGIVHRDVKPSNILVRTSDGRLKITDFGIAHVDDPDAKEKTQAGEILGTPAYMSPEQVLGRPVDGRSDIFSLGIILYELCAGWRPFGGENLGAVFHAITSTDPPSIEGGDPDIPGPLASAVMKCLRKAPGERFQSARTLAETLRACVVKDGITVPPPPAPARSRGPVVAAAILALAAVGGGLGYVALRTDRAREAPAVSVPAPQPATAFLALSSTPPGAQVYVDGAFEGNAPVRLGLLKGKHEVRVTLGGYDDWEAQVDLAEGETPLSVTLSPKEKKG